MNTVHYLLWSYLGCVSSLKSDIRLKKIRIIKILDEKRNDISEIGLSRVSVVRPSKQPQIKILFCCLLHSAKKVFKCVLHVQQDSFFLFNQSDDWFVTLWLHMPHFYQGVEDDNATNQWFDWLNEGKVILLHVWHPFKCNFFDAVFHINCELLMTTRARSSKSFILCLYMKTIRVKKAKVDFVYFLQRDQHGLIAKHLTWRKVQF